MKKFVFFILFTCLANAQDYSKLFNSLDSVQKNHAVDHLRKIKKLINYEIIKSGIKIGEKEFIKGVFFIDNQGKFSVIIIDDNSKKYNDIISSVIYNIPISNCSKYYNEYASFRFKLNEISDLENYYNQLMEEETNKPQPISELNLYPAFKKSKSLDNKEKALKLFNDSMAEHIKLNFSYPEKALEGNIQGKTNITFIISSEGNIEEIYACNAHPIIQLEGIRIMQLLPKFIPGSINGKNVSIRYAQPLTFKMR